MVVTAVTLLLILASFATNKRGFKKYCYFCIVILSGVYFFFNPLLVWHGYDLARYYDQLRYYDQISLLDAFLGRGGYIGDSMFQDTISNYPLYNVYMFIFAKIGIPKLLAFVTGILCRSLELSSIFAVMDERKIILTQQQRTFLLGSFLMLHNLVEIGGIRNPIAVNLCIWAIVHELVLKRDRGFSILCYILACLCHSMAFVIVGIRLLLFLSDGIWKRVFHIMVFMIFISFMILNFFPTMLTSMILGLNLPDIVINAVGKIDLYTRDLTNYPVWQLVIFAYTYIIFFLIVSKLKKENSEDVGINDLYRFLFLFLLIVLLNVKVTSLFGRSRMLIYPIFCICLPVYLTRNEQPFKSFSRMPARLIFATSAIFLIFSFDIYVSYLTMDSYIHI